jgi:hypothetical protein
MSRTSGATTTLRTRSTYDATLQVTPDVPHVFQGFAMMLDEAGGALTSAGEFPRAHLVANQDS